MHRHKTQRTPDQEQGAALVIVGLSLFIILGLTALVVDGGFIFNERRDAQNAADHAALAAAWAACNGNDPDVAAQASVTKNGYPVSELTLTELATWEYEADIDTTVANRFARVIGFDTTGVSAQAVGQCVLAGGGGGEVPGVIWMNYWYRTSNEDVFFLTEGGEFVEGGFANGVGCDPPYPCSNPIYDWSEGYAIRNIIENVTWTGPLYCTAPGCASLMPLDYPPNGPGYTVGAQQPDYPILLEFDYYRPNGRFGGEGYWGAGNYHYYPAGDPALDANGTLTLACPPPGVYVVDGNFHLSGEACGDPDFLDITIVTSGWIMIEDSKIEPFNATKHGLVMAAFSDAAPYRPLADPTVDEWCSQFDPSLGLRTAAICHHAEDNWIKGLEYAPNGHVRHADDDNFVIPGAIIAESGTIIPEESQLFFGPEFLETFAIPTVVLNQ